MYFWVTNVISCIVREGGVAPVPPGESPELEKAWGVKGPFWARHYIFWAGSCPLCVIYEVFSPKLEQYLGGCEAGSDAPGVNVATVGEKPTAATAATAEEAAAAAAAAEAAKMVR
jgi:hypothetical protein